MRAVKLALRDLRLELRGRTGLLSALFFIGVVLLVMGFALGPNENTLRQAAPGVWWVALAFAGSLLAARVWGLEAENNTLDNLLLTPGSREWLYLGKLLFLWLLLMVFGVVMLVLVAGLFHMSLTHWSRLLMTLFLGGSGYAIIASFYAGLTARLRGGDVLLPVLVFPMVFPVVLGSVKATLGLAMGADLNEVVFWWKFLMVFDIVFLTLCTLLFPSMIEG